MNNNKKIDKDVDMIEKVIKIDRVNKVVKGGKRLAFRAFVITGDQACNVGFGLGKSKEVPVAIKKAVDKLINIEVVFHPEKEYKFVNPSFKKWLAANFI